MPIKSQSRARRVCVVLMSALLATSVVQAASLSELFEAERYEAFFAAARPAAEQGDAEALFLLGKAAHLGKGMAVDLTLAAQWYEQARARGSARASHNLGSLALEAGRREEAVPFFEEALARGLKLPTLYNLGRALTPEDPRTVFDAGDAAAMAALAAQRFAEAYAERADTEYAAAAGKQYLRVYLMQRSGDEPTTPEALAKSRATAVLWLNKAMDAGDPFAWTNYGALLLDERKYAEARVALEKGAAGNNGVAHYHLARMAQEGAGGAASDPDVALVHFEKAALLGIEPARQPALRLLEAKYQSENDLGELERGVARLAALRRESDFQPLHDPAARAAWGRFLIEQKSSFQQALRPQVRLVACGLGLNDEFGREFNVGEGTEWRLLAHVSLAETIVLEARGSVDGQGCARTPEALTPADHELLRRAASVSLVFPGPELPLELIPRDRQQATLQLRPIGAVLPPR
jgi:TPR repeat protein